MPCSICGKPAEQGNLQHEDSPVVCDECYNVLVENAEREMTEARLLI